MVARNVRALTDESNGYFEFRYPINKGHACMSTRGKDVGCRVMSKQVNHSAFDELTYAIFARPFSKRDVHDVFVHITRFFFR